MRSDSTGSDDPDRGAQVAESPDSDNLTPDQPVTLPPFLISPKPQLGKQGEVHMLTVYLRSTGDKTRDDLKMRRIHGIITSYPGDDRFALHLFEKGNGYLVEFPNHTVGLCDDMLSRLRDLAGNENIVIEKITFQ